MPTRTATHYVLAAVLLLFGVGSGFAQCPEDPVSLTIDSQDVRGTGTLHIAGGAVTLELDLTTPCEKHIVANGIATAETIQIMSGGVSLIGSCADTTFTINLVDPCGSGQDYEDISVSTGGGGQSGDDDDDDDIEPGDDDDDDDDNNNGGGNGQPLDFRSPKGGTRPEAKLIDIEVDVNPAVVKIDDLGANQRLNSNDEIHDVTFTARLVFSGGKIPESFLHRTSGWEFWPVREDLPEDNKWSEAMQLGANLKFNRAWVPGLDPIGEGEQEDEHNKLNVNVFFTALPGSNQGRFTGAGRVQTQKVPIRVVYRSPDGEVFNKTVNLQVERKASSGSFAGSSGPASRIVTSSRVLE